MITKTNQRIGLGSSQLAHKSRFLNLPNLNFHLFNVTRTSQDDAKKKAAHEQSAAQRNQRHCTDALRRPRMCGEHARDEPVETLPAAKRSRFQPKLISMHCSSSEDTLMTSHDARKTPPKDLLNHDENTRQHRRIFRGVRLC